MDAFVVQVLLTLLSVIFTSFITVKVLTVKFTFMEKIVTELKADLKSAHERIDLLLVEFRK